MAKLNTIIFFIRNTSQVKNYIDPFAELLIRLGYHIVIIHINSLTNSESTSDDSQNSNYTYYDYGKMNYGDFISKIKDIHPKLIVCINFMSLMDLLLIRISQRNNYKILYIEHGTFNKEISMKYKTANIFESVVRYYYFINKYTQYLYCNKSNIYEEILLIYNALIKHNYTNTTYDYGIFYSEYSMREKNKILNISDNNIFISGYPIVKNKEELQTLISASLSNKIVYLHQPFVLDKISNITYKDEIKYLNQIIKVFSDNNYEFHLRLHPRESIKNYNDLLDENIMIVEKDVDLITNLLDARIILGHHSTALFAGIIINKPIILIPFPGYNDVGLPFLNDISHVCNNIDEIRELLDNNEIDKYLNKYPSFIKEYIGHHNHYEHKVDIINNLASKMSVK